MENRFVQAKIASEYDLRAIEAFGFFVSPLSKSIDNNENYSAEYDSYSKTLNDTRNVIRIFG